MCTAKEYEKALVDPASIFESPAAVLSSTALTSDQKRAVLEHWEVDAVNLAVATEENMAGGEPSRLDEVRAALNALGDRQAA
jgi:hypothetical protein